MTHVKEDMLNERTERGIAVFAETFGVGTSELPDLLSDRVGSRFAAEAVLAAEARPGTTRHSTSAAAASPSSPH
ncbi:hypothetical protein ACFTTN_22885 [Streptomyces niveus]|uniref:hypothetical protein n=1 Tax=Streptomyces niveus TaxID=193462 RepID=UPI003641242D